MLLSWWGKCWQPLRHFHLVVIQSHRKLQMCCENINMSNYALQEGFWGSQFTIKYKSLVFLYWFGCAGLFWFFLFRNNSPQSYEIMLAHFHTIKLNRWFFTVKLHFIHRYNFLYLKRSLYVFTERREAFDLECKLKAVSWKFDNVLLFHWEIQIQCLPQC